MIEGYLDLFQSLVAGVPRTPLAAELAEHLLLVKTRLLARFGRIESGKTTEARQFGRIDLLHPDLCGVRRGNGQCEQNKQAGCQTDDFRGHTRPERRIAPLADYN